MHTHMDLVIIGIHKSLITDLTARCGRPGCIIARHIITNDLTNAIAVNGVNVNRFRVIAAEVVSRAAGSARLYSRDFAIVLYVLNTVLTF